MTAKLWLPIELAQGVLEQSLMPQGEAEVALLPMARRAVVEVVARLQLADRRAELVRSPPKPKATC